MREPTIARAAAERVAAAVAAEMPGLTPERLAALTELLHDLVRGDPGLAALVREIECEEPSS